jgi:Flp pilus assembly protein TadD
MRGGPLILVLLLAACGHTQSVVSGLEPGVDVAQAALRGGSPETALQLASGVLAHDPGNEAALVVQGNALTELGRFDEARDSYNRALQSNPASVGAEVGLGRLRLGDDPAAAEVLFDQALVHDPRNTTALNDLGVARDLQGHHAQAQEAYRQALGIDPQLSSAQVNLALSMAMSGSASDAVRMLRPMASDPNASRKLRHDLAAALTMAGDREEAARILSKDLSPEDVQRALDAYAAARSGSGRSVMAASGGSAASVALAPGVATPPAPAIATANAPTIATANVSVTTAAALPAIITASAPAPAAPPASARPSAPEPATAVASTAAPTTATASAPTTATAATEAPASAADASAPAQAGNISVQLATLPDEAAARAEWRRVQHKMPSLLSDRQPVFVKTTYHGHTTWHVRTGDFADESQATAFCREVRAAGGGCLVSGS